MQGILNLRLAVKVIQFRVLLVKLTIMTATMNFRKVTQNILQKMI